MSSGNELEITVLEDSCYRVCLTEDGFTECCYVSSMHLTAEKEPQLRTAIRKKALNTLFD
jgi:ATP-dependent phosphoenolpyruvate carboxykinase